MRLLAASALLALAPAHGNDVYTLFDPVLANDNLAGLTLRGQLAATYIIVSVVGKPSMRSSVSVEHEKLPRAV